MKKTIITFSLVLLLVTTGWSEEKESSSEPSKDSKIQSAALTEAVGIGGKYRPQRIIVADFESEPSCFLDTRFEAWGSCYPYTRRIGPFDPQFDPKYVHTGWGSYRIVNGIRSKKTWGCFSMNLGPVTDISKDPIGIRPLDVSRYTYLSFWVMGTHGGENFKIIFRDAQAENYMPVTIFTPDEGVADAKWKRVLVNLNEVKQKMEGYVQRTLNLSQLVSIGIEIGDNVGNTRGSAIFIDDIEFIK
ncbi:MAG: hypothetical protein P9M13_03695 [Candidatus Ancaeobacter aquaticus]|nr:hypothetical protein [Candidatus Ancaeobacter aquaticus]